MSFFDDVYKKIFGKNQSPKIIHELLIRSDDFNKSYQDWTKAEEKTELLNSVRTSYELKKKGIEQNPVIHVLTSKYANGFAISFSEAFQKNDFAFLLEYFSSKVLEKGYKLANSDFQVSYKNNYTESIEKKYLKPKIGVEPPIDQKFGNVLIENVSINDKPSFFKFQASIYSDRLYSDPYKFDDLLAHILN